MYNVTYRNIFLNGMGGPQAPGRRGGGVGGPHFKTQRGRGGLWENVTWDNIYGTHATAAVSFGENHGGDVPVTNASATPRIKNMVVQNVHLTNTAGTSMIASLAEAPIENLTMRNITTSGGWSCTGYDGTKVVSKTFATGVVEGVNPPMGRCSYVPPPPPTPPVTCRVKQVRGCYNDTGVTLLPVSRPQHHDNLTRENCAALCYSASASAHSSTRSIDSRTSTSITLAGIDQGNHCSCGSAVAGGSAHAVALSKCTDPAWWVTSRSSIHLMLVYTFTCLPN